jgi:ABC-2 type transport system permease protein
VRASDDLGVPAVAAGDIALGAVWFVLGLALYGFLYAAGGALVDKVTEVNNAVMPISMVIFGGYFASFLVTMEDGADSPLSVLLSMFPLTAPVAMPLRWASGGVPTYQLVMAMALTAATAVALVWLASTIYRRALVITGHRVRFHEVFARPGMPRPRPQLR